MRTASCTRPRRVQGLLGIGDAISEIAITGDDYRRVQHWYPRIAGPPAMSLKPLDRTGPLPGQYAGGAGRLYPGVYGGGVSGAVFGLVNTLVMAVFERVREIGLMQALGMRPGLITGQIMLESFYLLGLGLLVGNVLAVATLMPLATGIDIYPPWPRAWR